MIPGETILSSSSIEANAGREAIALVVENTGDRPVQVGSHFHLFEVNRALVFDRARSYGMRPDIPAGTAIRFEPGQDKEVLLVSFGGTRRVYGLNGLTEGRLEEEAGRAAALEKAATRGFGGA